MSNQEASGKASVKTLAIRLEPELHTQLSVVAQLRGSTITDEIRTAIETHIEAVRSTPELTAKADEALADIERQLVSRREVLTSFLGSETAGRAKRSPKRDSQE